LVEKVEIGGKVIEHVTVATTRPETMLGDTAVAMNPTDPRAKHLLGKKVRLPIAGRVIPIIADDHVVLPDPGSEDEKARFSTGFLKVTPAHDPDDYAIGQRHGLAMVNVMAPDGTISDKHGWDDCSADAQFLLGMDRFEAREAIVEWFRKENLLADVRPYTHQVGHSYRSHVPIEPYLSDQWYIAVRKLIPNCRLPIADCRLNSQGVPMLPGTDVPTNSLAGLALSPLLEGRLKFTPTRYADTYRSWLENLRDWPISRQLWWGHQIPIWSQDLELNAPTGPEHANRGPEPAAVAALDKAIGGPFSQMFKPHKVRYILRVDPHPEEAGWVRTYICLDRDDPAAIRMIEQAGWHRDADVLDTWFSSALWPFSTMGWPQDTPELKKYYPTDVLCTAREIITLWVSRMVMMGQYCLGDIPFTDVFIHAMLQDGEGRKMSKSLGNGIDPLDIIDSHGTDAMRFTLVSMTTQTQDVRMPVEEMTLPDGRSCRTSPKFDAGRNFCNKLWNAARFTMMNLHGQPAWTEVRPAENLADAWILSWLNGAIRDATAALEAFRFNELADRLYHFLWDEFCDWYLEIAKARINGGQAAPKAVLAHCLDVLLRLLHPIIPFITEALWVQLNEVAPVRGPADEQAEPLLALARWPLADAGAINEKAEKDFELLAELVRQIRNARSRHNVPPGKKLTVLAEAAGQTGSLIADNAELLKSQANLAEVAVHTPPVDSPADAAIVTVAGVKLYVLGLLDRAAEVQRLEKQAETLRRGVQGIEDKLANQDFLAKAPPAVIQREKERLEQLKADLAAVEKSLAALK
jgi:valyl-tRNA synthetase